MSVGFSDPRVHLEVCDGIKFIGEAPENTYDAIIVDSSDPVGPAEVLFQQVNRSREFAMAIIFVSKDFLSMGF